MDIRQLVSTDAEAYRSIRLEALQYSPASFASSYAEEREQDAEKYRKRFTRPSHTFTFGAFEDDRLIGVVTLIREQLLKLSHRATIVAMYTFPTSRRSGAGKALLRKAIEKAETLEGLEQIHLTVVSSNTAAKQLYLSQGFQVCGIEKKALKDEGTYYDEERMVLFL